MDVVATTFLLSWALEALTQKAYENSIDDIYYILNGDLTKMDDIYILEEEETKINITDMTLVESPEKLFPDVMELLEDVSEESFSDVAEFNEITNKIASSGKSTRKASIYIYFMGMNDPDDYYFTNVTEMGKRQMLMDIALTFLIHSRYKIYAALKQREPVRSDKRYKLGYLFNRLRRLKYDQNKLISAAMRQDKDVDLLDLHSVLRIYQTVLKLDIDIRDTINLVKTVYKEPDPWDVLKAKKTTTKGKT